MDRNNMNYVISAYTHSCLEYSGQQATV